MEVNEIRYYLQVMRGAMTPVTTEGGEVVGEAFKPTYLVTAVKLPTGAIELAVNTEGILDKIDYILNAYDEDMRLKTNPQIVMQQLMVV